MQSLIQAENISKRFGDKLLFSNISLNINPNDKAALVALNGTGKTTLLKILSGLDKPDDGKISCKKDLHIAYLPQNPILDDNLNVMDAVFYADTKRVKSIRDYRDALGSGDMKRIQQTGEVMDSLQLWDYEHSVKQILTQLDITDFKTSIKSLSGGQKKRVALASVLIDDADLIILDEPTNHLDLEMIEWLEDYLLQSNAAVFMVTHDRYFLDRVCTRIVEMDDNTIYSYQGNYATYLQNRSQRKEIMVTGAEKARNLMRTELEWIRRMPKARTSKPRYRIDAFKGLKEAAQNVPYDKEMKIAVKSERLGKKILEIDHLYKSFDDKHLIKDFSFRLSPNEKIGVVGKNGTGKTTLLNILTGLVAPDSGSVVWGSTVNYSYYKQDGLSFKNNDRPIDIITDIAEYIVLEDGRTLSASAFLQHFLFPPDLQYSHISKLSGGEKRRLYLCSVLINRPNILILDEPTNDLDLLSLQVLERYLIDFKGVVIIVSHDRYFMDKIVDHTLVFNENGKISDFPGNYTVYRTVTEDQEKKESKDSIVKKLKIENKPKTTPSKTKLSYRDKYEMEQLDKDLKELNRQKILLEKALNSGRLDAGELQLKSKEYVQLSEQIDDKEFRWLELSEFIG